MTSEPIPSPSSGATSAQNVLLIVDAESVLSRYPNPSLDAAAPTSIADGFIFFATGDNSKKIVTNDSKFTIRGDIDRELHVRARSVSLIAEHSIVMYALTADGDALSDPRLEVHTNLTVPAPNPDNPAEPGSKNADDHLWICTPKNSGTAHCHLSFMLVNQQCEAVGYFDWSTKIEITK